MIAFLSSTVVLLITLLAKVVPACEVFSKIFLLRRNFAKFMFVSARPIKRERHEFACFFLNSGASNNIACRSCLGL